MRYTFYAVCVRYNDHLLKLLINSHIYKLLILRDKYIYISDVCKKKEDHPFKKVPFFKMIFSTKKFRNSILIYLVVS